MCHDDYIARGQLNLQIAFEANNSRTLDHKMINHQMRRVRSEQLGQLRRGGVLNPQGAENSALKYSAPFNTTPRRISENTSMSSLD